MAFVDGDLLKTQKRFTLHHFRNLGFGKKDHEKVILEEAQALIDEFLEANEPVQTEVIISEDIVGNFSPSDYLIIFELVTLDID